MSKMQSPTNNDDNDSIHSDESIISSFSAQKEKLDNLITMELKHSGVYRDIHFKDSLLTVDLENVYNTNQRLDSQIKNKSKQLDALYDKMSDDTKENVAQLEKKLLLTNQELAEINTLFCEAYDNYSYDVIKDTYEYLKTETDKVEQNISRIRKEISVLQQKEKINHFCIKAWPTQDSDMNNAVNGLMEITMKRPEIELEEASVKLVQEIRQLQKQLSNFPVNH